MVAATRPCAAVEAVKVVIMERPEGLPMQEEVDKWRSNVLRLTEAQVELLYSLENLIFSECMAQSSSTLPPLAIRTALLAVLQHCFCSSRMAFGSFASAIETLRERGGLPEGP